MGKRGPKPSGEALTGAERQRRYRERQEVKAQGTLCIQIGEFERRFIEAEAEVSGESPEEIAAQLLQGAIWGRALKMWREEFSQDAARRRNLVT